MPIVSFTTSGALGKVALRQANDRLVLDSIRREPGISRAAISRLTGFPRTSVTFVVNRLIRRGLVKEEKIDGGTQAGRPPTALHLVADAMLAIGVEISKPVSRVMLVDLNGEPLRTQNVAWRNDPALLLHDIYVAARSVAARRSNQVLGVGVSLPGTIDKATGLVVAAEAHGWFGVDVGKYLQGHLGWPLFFENDANLCAIAEQWFGGPETESLRYFVYVGARGGLGTGAVVDGRILHGISSAGVEFGHVMLYPDGRPCRCGNRGCWEQYASDEALVRAYRELGGKAGEDSLDVARRARAGDESAIKAVRNTAEALALGIVNLVAALNPQAIILGEPFATPWEIVEEVVRNELRRRVPAYYLTGLRLLPARTGADAALRGAAALVLANFFTRFDPTRDDSLPEKAIAP
jgi:predicted NBD/HSP70 family sugar kinase